MIVTKSNIADLKQNPAWLEIVDRALAGEQTADKQMENPDPFLHGRATGSREAWRAVLSLPEKLLAEVDKKR